MLYCLLMTNYLRFIAFFLWIPLLFVILARPKLLWRYRKTLTLVTLFTFLFGVPWDALSIATGLWWYDLSPTIGNFFLLGLPIDEFILILTFPVLIGSFTLIAKHFWKD